jgi:hypothetical protein
MMERYHCEPFAHIDYPAGTRPPELFAYPKPSGPIRLVFIGWNPPKPFGGFWSLDGEDNLRTSLHEILQSTKEISANHPDGVFLEEFLSKGFFFLHAVKCWTMAKFPGFGRDARKEDRDIVGLPLVRACAGTHLRTELENLKPAKVCALGQVPYLGVCHAFRVSQRLEDFVTPTEGRLFEPSTTGLGWPLLYTCFPQPQTVIVRGKSERVAAKELTRRHLEGFL